MYVGYDSKGNKLNVWDICKFKINKNKYEGIIVYDEDTYSYAFEMKDDNFPIILMKNCNDIEKIISVTSTKIDDEYEFYRNLYREHN